MIISLASFLYFLSSNIYLSNGEMKDHIKSNWFLGARLSPVLSVFLSLCFDWYTSVHLEIIPET